MFIDLTDWAALLEALDGVKGQPPLPPPLPSVGGPFIVGAVAARRRQPVRHAVRQPDGGVTIPRSQ